MFIWKIKLLTLLGGVIKAVDSPLLLFESSLWPNITDQLNDVSVVVEIV